MRRAAQGAREGAKKYALKKRSDIQVEIEISPKYFGSGRERLSRRRQSGGEIADNVQQAADRYKILERLRTGEVAALVPVRLPMMRQKEQ